MCNVLILGRMQIMLSVTKTHHIKINGWHFHFGLQSNHHHKLCLKRQQTQVYCYNFEFFPPKYWWSNMCCYVMVQVVFNWWIAIWCKVIWLKLWHRCACIFMRNVSWSVVSKNQSAHIRHSLGVYWDFRQEQLHPGWFTDLIWTPSSWKGGQDASKLLKDEPLLILICLKSS